jgi:hypothetical protein
MQSLHFQNQLVEYFHSRGMKPLPPISQSQVNLNPSEADEDSVDLNVDISPEGEISVAAYNGPVYDDSKYDTFQTYAGGNRPPQQTAPFVPPTSTAPYVPSSQHNLNHQGQFIHSHAYQKAPQAPQYAPQHGLQHQQAAQRPTNTPSNSTSSPQRANFFHVQIPPNATSGMQLQIVNPVTRQNMIVTIPQGVPPGGRFAVRY